MQAIMTVYHGPTDTKGARIVARASAGRCTVEWDHAANNTDNHTIAAARLVHKLGWTAPGTWVAGQLPSGAYAHVFVPEGSTWPASNLAAIDRWYREQGHWIYPSRDAALSTWLRRGIEGYSDPTTADRAVLAHVLVENT